MAKWDDRDYIEFMFGKYLRLFVIEARFCEEVLI